jgi:7-carboxy-7-deazaguanine synthase
MQTNTQKPEARHLDPEGKLELHHVFPTIQGEGPFVGRPSIFIRLAGCNLQCPACDTDYTSRRDLVTPEAILAQVRQYTPEGWHNEAARRNNSFNAASRPLVVITGGEPFRQNLRPLVVLLMATGYQVQIETNGTLFLEDFPYYQVTVVCSPKTPRINNELAYNVSAFKYVIEDGQVHTDGLPLTTMAQHSQGLVARPPTNFRGEIFVQPLDTKDSEQNLANTKACIQSAMKHGYRLCIQSHKNLGLE